MLSKVATVGQENPCRVRPAYLCSRQVLRPGQGHQLDRVGQGGAWAGLWVAVSPHKGHKGHNPAAGKPQGPQGNAGELVRGSRALGLLLQTGAIPRRMLQNNKIIHHTPRQVNKLNTSRRKLATTTTTNPWNSSNTDLTKTQKSTSAATPAPIGHCGL